MVAGWGETGFMVNDAPTNPQKQVTVPIVSLSECREKLSTVLTNVDEYLDQTGGEICAGGHSMRDACTVRLSIFRKKDTILNNVILVGWRGTVGVYKRKWKVYGGRTGNMGQRMWQGRYTRCLCECALLFYLDPKGNFTGMTKQSPRPETACNYLLYINNAISTLHVLFFIMSMTKKKINQNHRWAQQLLMLFNVQEGAKDREHW